VRLKRAAFKDADLGTLDYVRRKTVLDVGCGPSLNLPHMENCHREANAYVGIDASAAFVLSSKRENPESKYRFAQASVLDLPFPDKAFDTSLVSFTIHHVDDREGRLMRELIRVTRSNIVIFDHLRADTPTISRIQDMYWRLFDGGCNYMQWHQWERYLESVNVDRKLQTGAIFGHVLKLACSLGS
jgi:ubiquinone/menaquinone biosynthesis C-methylase UbiE